MTFTAESKADNRSELWKQVSVAGVKYLRLRLMILCWR